MRPSFFHHLHPPTIPAEQARWRYTLGAGGMAIFLLLILILTGALEMFYYTPTPADAALSIQTLTYLIPFGGLIRSLHFWSAQLLMIVSAVHLLRVVFTGAYIPPRRFNYLLGLTLFVIALLINFTGYVLRWDMGIQWALIVGTNLLKTIPLMGNSLYALIVGGAEPGESTLIRFYAWHIFGLMLPAAILTGWHAFRVRRDGGIAVPPPSLRPVPERITRFELVRRESAAMLFTAAALILLAVFSPAPIAAPIPASAASSSAHPLTSAASSAHPLESADNRAPWFFLWIQQMLKWGDPFFFGILVPLMLLAILALIPYIFPQPQESELGRWFPKSSRLAQAAVVVIGLFVIILTLVNG